MLIQSVFAAAREVFSPALRRILWKSVGLTLALLALVWLGLTKLLDIFLTNHDLSASYPILDSFAFFLAGFGLFVALIYLLPAVSAIVAGYFLDDVAEVVESKDYPVDPPGRALPFGQALLYGIRFAGLSLLVNFAALFLLFIPGINIAAFFVANAYLLGREYFELAAGRFWSAEEVARLRHEHRGTVLAAGAVLAGLVLVPVLNLLVPIFGATMMVHLHKRLTRGRAAIPSGREGQASLQNR
ncbi:sulfate transporter family protein [Microvirga arsenatis]|uniref:Sulfate transporter family protein n=1 Tax=Microvirga arsenatis TaxID=2692265 RepID=A0ABW9YTU8_9HYPH|nr:sulfate transporter family protein [Microvirga arsenatis]NBJ09343.1 sulfate transporter family protein [Microvirga arsenatis]NBJ23799.1 sulfate transporter family protein [Microvirga arsenatis]